MVLTSLLIAPSMQHRIEFRQGDKEHVVAVATRLTIAGLTLLALGMIGVVVLVCDFLFGAATTIVVAGLIAAVFAWAWYITPIARLRRIRRL